MSSSLIKISVSAIGDTDNSLSFETQGPMTHDVSENFEILTMGRIINPQLLQTGQGLFCPAKLVDTSIYPKLNGHFSIIVLSKIDATCRIINSRSGGCRLYFQIYKNELLVSNSMKLLNTLVDGNSFDEDALNEMLNFRWLTQNESLISGISLLHPGNWIDYVAGEKPNAQPFWKYPLKKQIVDTLDSQADKAELLLQESLKKSIKKNSRVAVLLSGGVDSAVLAAMLSSLDIPFTAISHRNTQHPNPELEIAANFAKQLGVKHQIAEISDSEIKTLFEETCLAAEHPPRAHSDLILTKLFSTLQGKFDQVLYGEAADTLFGSNMVNRFKRKLQKRKLLSIPLFPQILSSLGKSKQLDRLQNLSAQGHFFDEQILDLTELEKQFLHQFNFQQLIPVEFFKSEEYLDKNDNSEKHAIALLKAINFKASVSSHFHSACILANQFNIEIVSPFVDYEVVEFAASLNDQNYFGDGFVKPVLRKIGERYFDHQLMYLPKQGFPVPHSYWIDAALDATWHDTAKRFNFDPDMGGEEMKWTLMGLSVLSSHFGFKEGNLRPL